MILSDHSHDLIFTGFMFGLVHVLAGPDHLSALAALSVGSSWRAFSLGFRWGIGHSTGLVVVAIFFIYLKGDIDLHSLGRYCDIFVGLFMIILGCYGTFGALQIYRQKRGKRDSDSLCSKNLQNQSKKAKEGYTHEISDYYDTETQAQAKSIQDVNDHHYEQSVKDCICLQWCPLVDMQDPYTQRIVSFSIGLLHGVAGPGGILGVLPAVEMQNWRSSFLYLGSFIITSTMAMGMFAAMYGELTKRIGATAESVELGLGIFSSFMSIFVGIIWLSFSVLGVEKEFHSHT